MHMADALLAPAVAATMYVASGTAAGVSISKLKKGATVTCLAEYRGWIYVEAKVSGKTARGFIPPSSLNLKGAEGGSPQP